MTTYYFNSNPSVGNDANNGLSSAAPKLGASANSIAALLAAGHTVKAKGSWTNQRIELTGANGWKLDGYDDAFCVLDYRKAHSSGWTHIGSQVWKKSYGSSPTNMSRVLFGASGPFSEGTDVAKRLIDAASGGSVDSKVINTIGSGAFASPNPYYAWYWDKANGNLYVRGNSTGTDPWTQYGGVWSVDRNEYDRRPIKLVGGSGYEITGLVKAIGACSPLAIDGSGGGTIALKADYSHHIEPQFIIIGGHSAINGLILDGYEARDSRPLFDEHFEMQYDDGNGRKDVGGRDTLQIYGQITNLIIRKGVVEGMSHGAITLQQFSDGWEFGSGTAPSFASVQIYKNYIDLRNGRYARALGTFGTRSNVGSIVIEDNLIDGSAVRSQIASAKTTVRRNIWRNGRDGSINMPDKYTGVQIVRANIGDYCRLWGVSGQEIDNTWIEDNIFIDPVRQAIVCDNSQSASYWGGSNAGFRNNWIIKRNGGTAPYVSDQSFFYIDTSANGTCVLQGNKYSGYSFHNVWTGSAQTTAGFNTLPNESGTAAMTSAEVAAKTASADVNSIGLTVSSVAVPAGQYQDITATVLDRSGNPVAGFSEATPSTSDAGVATAQLMGASDASGKLTVRVTGVSTGNASVAVSANRGGVESGVLAAAPTPATVYDIKKVVDDILQKNSPAGWYPAIGPRTLNIAAPTSPDQWGSDATSARSYAYVDCPIRAADKGPDGTGYQPAVLSLDTALGGTIASGDTIVCLPFVLVADAYQQQNTATNERAQLRNARLHLLKTDGTWETADSRLLTWAAGDYGVWANFWNGGGNVGVSGSALLAIEGNDGSQKYYARFEDSGHANHDGGVSLGGIGQGTRTSSVTGSVTQADLAKFRDWMWACYPLTAKQLTKAQWQSDVVGVVVSIEGRFLKHDSGSAADFASAGYIVNVGADWYRNVNGVWTYVSPFMHGRWRLLATNGDWDLYGASNIDANTLIANPPPGFTTSNPTPTGAISVTQVSAMSSVQWDGDGTTTVTPGWNAVAGDMLLATWIDYGGGTLAVKDTINLSSGVPVAWTKEVSNLASMSPANNTGVAYFNNTAAGAFNVTATYDANAFVQFNVMEITGQDDVSPIRGTTYAEDLTTRTGTPATTVGTGHASTKKGDLVIAVLNVSLPTGFGAVGLSTPAGWTEIGKQNVGGDFENYIACYQIAAADGAPTITFPAHYSDGKGIKMISIKPKAGTVDTGGTKPNIAQTTLPAGTEGVAYDQTLTASGAVPITWSATGLPAGVTIDALTGKISGTPTVSAIYGVLVKATNSAGEDTQDFQLLINPVTREITTESLPIGQVDVPYSGQLAGNFSGTWSATGLPGGLTLNAASGAISGTPTSGGVFTPSFTLDDGVHSASKTIGISIAAAGVKHPIINQFILPNATVGVAYSVTLTGEAGTWGAINLPAGLSINSSTGVISGTPTTAGQYSPIISLTAGSDTNLVTSALKVNPSGAGVPSVVTTSLASATVGTAYSQGLSATNTPTSWLISGLPPGFSYNYSTGTITAASPSVLGLYQLTIVAHNAAGDSDPVKLQLLVRSEASSTGTSAWARALKGQS